MDLEYRGYDPAAERLQEVLCTLGNGYMATHGAAPESRSGPVHYPGKYVAGCYDRLRSDISGHEVENEDMVNLPDWLPLRFRPLPEEGTTGAWLSPDHCRLLDYRQVPLPELSAFRFSLRFRGHWGVSLRLDRGRLRIGTPDSEQEPIRLVLPDRTITRRGVRPPAAARLGLPQPA